jgi:hypothetical protein
MRYLSLVILSPEVARNRTGQRAEKASRTFGNYDDCELVDINNPQASNCPESSVAIY